MMYLNVGDYKHSFLITLDIYIKEGLLWK